MNEAIQHYNKKILLAVDSSENSRRAVSYVAQMLKGLDGCCIIFLHVINPPEEDYFSGRSEQEKWIQEYRLKIESQLEEYRRVLVREGFDPKTIALRTTLRYRPSIAECILAEQDRLDCSTIVVGRHGLSRGEEILFGSISSKIVSHARNCTVWVVE
ncbi:MAG: universal stress protein [Pseudomonadota bacterium]|nr:universal stress protein [Pseudomonadota bacterium]